jgi:vacuolar-type H+-ATPase subunit I/STV1
VVQLAVSSTKSTARNSTKPIVNSKNSSETAATNSAAPLLTRRKRSLPTKSGGGCNKLIESIQLSTSSVRSAYCDLSNTEELDPRFNEKKAAYETEVAQLREKLDSKDLQIEQKYKTKIEQLNQDFQKLEKNMRDTLEKLESVDNLYRRAQAKVVIASLKSGDIKEALEEFEKIESLNNTIILITIALQDEFRIPIENVINFARGMKELEAVVHGTIHIFYELEKKQGFIEKKVVSLLKETVEGIMKQLVEREQKGNLASNIDRATVGQLVLLFNKLDYLLVSPFKYN